MSRPMLFTPLPLREITVKNRIVVAPMHQYAAKKGFPTDWHLMNAGRFAVGGAGLVMVESTKVERRGCGTVGDLGLWDDAMIPHFKRLADFITENGAVAGLQLGHSGRQDVFAPGRAASRWSGRRRRPRAWMTGRIGSWSPPPPCPIPATPNPAP